MERPTGKMSSFPPSGWTAIYQISLLSKETLILTGGTRDGRMSRLMRLRAFNTLKKVTTELLRMSL